MIQLLQLLVYHSSSIKSVLAMYQNAYHLVRMKAICKYAYTLPRNAKLVSALQWDNYTLCSNVGETRAPIVYT